MTLTEFLLAITNNSGTRTNWLSLIAPEFKRFILTLSCQTLLSTRSAKCVFLKKQLGAVQYLDLHEWFKSEGLASYKTRFNPPFSTFETACTKSGI